MNHMTELATIAGGVAGGLILVLLAVWVHRCIQARRRWRWLVANRPATALWIATGVAAQKRARRR